MRVTSKVFIACVVIFATLTAIAQNGPAAGLYAFGSFDSRGFDTINRGNLNVHFVIPIISKQGRGGTNFSYALNYDSLIWSPVSSSGARMWTPSYEWGWTDSTNAEFGYVTYDMEMPSCIWGPNHLEGFYLRESNFQYHDEHGKSHPFPMGYSSTCPDTSGPTGTGTYATNDNSGYTIYRSNSSYTAFSPGGADTAVGAYPNLDGHHAYGGGAGHYVDTNGNEITASSTGVFTDTTGKTVLTITGSGTPSSPVVYTYTDSNGNSQHVTVSYTSYTVQTNFGVSGTSEFSQAGVSLISSIVYSADDTSYTFTYEPTPGNPGDTTGRIASVTLRTGGTISYAYIGGYNGIEPDGTTANLNRTTADSSTPTSYTRSGISSTFSDTTIVNPSGNTGVYDFLINSGGYFFETYHFLYNAGASGTPVENTKTCYNATYPCGSSNADNGITTLATYMAHDGVTIGTDTKTFTSLGLLATDVGPTGVTSTNAYDTFTGPSSISFYRMASQKIQTSGTTNAETDYNYDETTPKTTSGLPQHFAVGTAPGNLTSVHRLVSGTTKITTATMTYDDAGQVLTATDANNNTTTYGYDSTDTFATSVTRPITNNDVPNLSVNVPHVSNAQYDIQTGLMTSSTDENSQTTTYKYDGLERPSTIVYPDQGQTSYTYTPTSVTQKVLQSGSTTLDTTTQVDGYGRTIHVTYPNGSVADTIYGTSGRIYQTTNPHFSGGSPTDGTTTYFYDVLNRVTGVQNPDGTTRSENFNGETETMTDESGHEKQYLTDGLGRIVKVLEPDLTGALKWETDYTWTSLNELYTVSQKGDGSSPARGRTFNYDDEGRLTSQITPEQGTTSFGYDNNGNLQSRTDARNITTNYTYDALNRKLTEVAPNINYKYFWDEEVGLSSQNSIGRLVNESNWVNADEVYSYDQMGRVNWEASWTPSKPDNTSIVTQAAYDKAGEMTALTYPDGRVITMAYNQGQLVSGTYASWNGQPVNSAYLSNVTYGPPGNLTGEAFANGVQTVATNNSRLLLNTLKYMTSSQTLWSKQYTWSSNGMNLTKVTDLLNSGNTMTYGYDPDNRIASASASGVSETYTIDPWGNLKQSGNFSFLQNFSANNQISASGYTYDLAGNLTNDGNGNTYTYDADGMITASNGVQYDYDALDQRMDQFGGSNPHETIFFAGMPIALHNPSTGAYTDLLWGNGQMLGELAGTEQSLPTSVRLLDHLGSLALTTDQSGNVTGTNVFLPFGQLLNSSTSDLYQFTSLPQNTENASYHAGFRNLSTQQGRWLSPDPYNGSYDLTDPQSFNRYAYVNANPMAFVDPSGLHVATCNWSTMDCKPILLTWGGGMPGGSSWDEFDMMEIPTYVGGNGYGTSSYLTWSTSSSVGLTNGVFTMSTDVYSQNIGSSITYYSDPFAMVFLNSPGNGGGAIAPNNGTPRTPQQCAGIALKKNAVALSFDAAGIGAGFLPGGDLVVAGAQGAVSVASGINSAVHGDAAGSALGILGLPASFAGASAKFFGVGAKAIPGLGTAISAFGGLNDAYSTYQDYQACLAGH